VGLTVTEIADELFSMTCSVPHRSNFNKHRQT